MKGIANDKKADGAKHTNFYLPRWVEGDCLLFREAEKALGPDVAQPLISAQSLGLFQIRNRQPGPRSELSPRYCASQSSKGNRNEKTL